MPNKSHSECQKTEKEENSWLERKALKILSDIRSGKEKTLTRKEFFKKLKEEDNNE